MTVEPVPLLVYSHRGRHRTVGDFWDWPLDVTVEDLEERLADGSRAVGEPFGVDEVNGGERIAWQNRQRYDDARPTL